MDKIQLLAGSFLIHSWFWSLLCFSSAGTVLFLPLYVYLQSFALWNFILSGYPAFLLKLLAPSRKCLIHYYFPRVPNRGPFSWQTSQMLSVHNTESSHISLCPLQPLSASVVICTLGAQGRGKCLSCSLDQTAVLIGWFQLCLTLSFPSHLHSIREKWIGKNWWV